MVMLDFFLSFAIALILGTALSLVYRHQGMRPGSGFWFFFLVLFFAIWAGGVWLAPNGPELASVYWLNFIWIGLTVALLLAAAIAPRRIYLESLSRMRVRSSELRFEVEPGSVFNLSFWVLILLLAAGILSHYMGP